MRLVENVNFSPVYALVEDPYFRDFFKSRAEEMMRNVHEATEVVFFDKSCRPLSFLFQRLWPAFYPKEKFPRVSCLNIGTSKVSQLREYVRSLGFQPGQDPGDLILFIDCLEKCQKVYGKDNIETLKNWLSFSEGGIRLIVDDAEDTGGTIALGRKILETLDPGRENHFFLFRTPLFWDKNGTLVKDNPLGNPFFSVPQSDPVLIERGLEVLSTLEVIANEIIKRKPKFVLWD